MPSAAKVLTLWSASRDGVSTVHPPDKDRLSFDIDLRIGLDVWREIWDAAEPAHQALLASLVRYAYGRGYYDALVEPQRGQLCRDHGFVVPQRRLAKPAR